MALQFDRGQVAEGNVENAETLETVEMTVYDMAKERENMTKNLAKSKEVDDIVSTIEIHNPNSIVEFGGKAAEEISKCADQILNSLNMNQINDSGELLVTLGKIMDKFDIDEIREPKGGIFGKLFQNAKAQIEKILNKYNTMGGEVDKVFIKLKEYEAEIKVSNQKLEAMFKSNVGYYELLVKYILAGEQGLVEIDGYLANLQAEFEKTGDNKVQFDISALEQAKMLLEQRTHDLRIAENVAIQSIPMIKSMQYANLNLVRKINSAFIITLPVFKQALAQAILLKRQKVQTDAMSALDARTNEMLLKNARNTVEQTKLTAQMASGSSVKIETLEETWRTIVRGIDETKAIQDRAREQRASEVERLQTMKDEFFTTFGQDKDKKPY